ncbi:MAG: hypothetical protein PHU21_05420 [Elusimicrobia bacterium]|nr:hypothetical protein [Elusimicrobiota bacterium]
MAGEAFLHGAPGEGVSFRMPLAGTVLAWYNGHAPHWAQAAASGLLWVGPAALAFELGSLLQGPGAGGLAALLAAWPWSANEVGMGEEIIYKLLVGLVVLLLVWRASRPDWRRSAALGLAIGLSLLCRSTLFLLPPLLAAYDLLRGGPERDRRRSLAGAAALLVCSYALLAPWGLMNLRLHGRFIPLEDRRADSDVATAAIGIGPNLSGNYRWLAGIPDGDRVLSWAARRVLRHPGPYLAGCAERVRFVLLEHPLLWAAALLVFALRFRHEAFRQTALFCAYFAGIHCLLAIERRYLEPLWFVLSSAAAAGAWGLWPGPAAQRQPRPLGWLAWPYLAAAATAGLATLLCVIAFPGRPLPPLQVPVARALRSGPDDAWLLHLYSRELLRRGEASTAVASARRALELAPGQYPMQFTYAWALAASGRPARAWLKRITAGLEPGQEQRAEKLSRGHLLETLWHMAAGRQAQAEAAYARAQSAWRERGPSFRPLQAPRGAAAADRARRIDSELSRLDTRLADLARELLDAWPQTGRERLKRRLLDSSSRLRPLLLAPAPAGPPVTASVPGSDERKRAWQLQERGDYWGALRLLDRLLRVDPADAKLRSDRGVVYALLGRRREARDDFAAALRLDPALAGAYLSLASLTAGRGEEQQAVRLYETALREACPRLEPELCRLLDEPGSQACFAREPRVCGLIAQELARLQARR